MEPLYKCIWMTAGVLNYRLCDRAFDCDRCLVDRALREGKAPPGLDALTATAPQADAAVRTAPADPFRPFRYGFYHASHLWVRVGGAGIGRIGLDEIARRLLGRVNAIRLPAPGTNVRRDQVALEFVGEAGEVKLPAPLGGRIVTRNEELIAHPEALRADGPREAWIVRILPTHLREDLEGLLYGRRAAGWVKRELDRIRAQLLDARALQAGTLPDGGGLDPTFLEHMELSLRRKLVEELLLGPANRQKGR